MIASTKFTKYLLAIAKTNARTEQRVDFDKKKSVATMTVTATFGFGKKTPAIDPNWGTTPRKPTPAPKKLPGKLVFLNFQQTKFSKIFAQNQQNRTNFNRFFKN